MSENNVSFTVAGLLEVTATEQSNLAIPTWLAEALLVGQYWMLHLEIDGKAHIADVRFGGITLTTPLSLTPDIEQNTPHEPFRLITTHQTYTLQVKLGQTWKSLYRFDLQEQYLPDYEVSNWFVSTHPDSRFVQGLMAARPDRDRRYALLNNHLTTHYLDGRSDRQVLKNVTEFRAALANLFYLQLPTTPDLDRVLQQLIESDKSSSLL